MQYEWVTGGFHAFYPGGLAKPCAVIQMLYQVDIHIGGKRTPFEKTKQCFNHDPAIQRLSIIRCFYTTLTLQFFIISIQFRTMWMPSKIGIKVLIEIWQKTLENLKLISILKINHLTDRILIQGILSLLSYKQFEQSYSMDKYIWHKILYIYM